MLELLLKLDNPRGLTIAGGKIYVVGRRSGSLSQIDASRHKIEMVWSGEGKYTESGPPFVGPAYYAGSLYVSALGRSEPQDPRRAISALYQIPLPLSDLTKPIPVASYANYPFLDGPAGVTALRDAVAVSCFWTNKVAILKGKRLQVFVDFNPFSLAKDTDQD